MPSRWSNPPKLGDDCWCVKDSARLRHHRRRTDCIVDCKFSCKAKTLPITADDYKKALEHWRDHCYY